MCAYSLLLQEELIQQELLGSGRYGEVYIFSYNKKLYAGKMIYKNLLPGHPHPSTDQVNKFVVNMGCFSAIFHINQHSNIEVFHSEVQLTPYSPPILLTELLHENLNSYVTRMIGNLSFNKQLNLCHDMAKGLQFLHNLNVVHSNLHGNNVLISKHGQAKIGDYICPQIDALNERTASRYNVYMSPESTASKVISKQCDIYSLGALCLQVVTQNPPLPNDSIEVSDDQRWKEQMDQINKNPLQPLIARCFKFPIARPHIDYICIMITTLKQSPAMSLSNTIHQIEVH